MPYGLVTGDFNGDGTSDLAVANYMNNVAVLLGNGNATFLGATTLGTGGSNPSCVTIGDFNGDGMSDLAVANSAGNNIGVLINTSGTASSGGDYIGVSGTLTISSGSTSGTIVVPVIGDTMYEPNETFSVTLGTPTGAVLGTSQGAGQITNDDPMPTVSIAGFTASEGNSGTTGFGFLVSLTMQAIRRSRCRSGRWTGQPRSAGNDYTATNGTLTISSGSTSGTIVVPVIGDTMYETDETSP